MRTKRPMLKRKPVGDDHSVVRFKNFMDSLGSMETEKIYSKRKDRVYRKGTVYVKLTHQQYLDDAVNEIDLLRKFENHTSPFLMKICYNEVLNTPNNWYAVVASENAGSMIPDDYGDDKKNGLDVVLCFHDLFRGLFALHDIGYAHRDIHNTNYVRNWVTGRWTLIDFDLCCELEDDGKEGFLLHHGFPREHHPAILLNNMSDFDDTSVNVFNIMSDRYALREIRREMDYHQLILSILISFGLISEDRLPLLNPMYLKTDGMDNVDSDFFKQITNFMLETVTDTELYFRLNNDKSQFKLGFCNMLLDNITKNIKMVRTDTKYWPEEPEGFSSNFAINDSTKDIIFGKNAKIARTHTLVY